VFVVEGEDLSYLGGMLFLFVLADDPLEEFLPFGGESLEPEFVVKVDVHVVLHFEGRADVEYAPVAEGLLTFAR